MFHHKTTYPSHSKIFPVILIISYFLILFIWSSHQPFDTCPDEKMRYVISQYIYENNALPRADDASIIDKKFGFSYAGRPVLSSILSAFFMKIRSLFPSSEFSLLMAARMENILCGIGFMIVVMAISRELFQNRKTQYFFTILTCFWPQCAFLFTYVNSDGLAMLAVSLILYCWINGLKHSWRVTDCLLLGIGLSIGMLSYYNIYGFILCSAVLFLFYFITVDHSNGKYKKMLTHGALIAVIVLLLSGWFFIRNAVLYQGDFFSFRTTAKMGNTYGEYGFRPKDWTGNSMAFLSTPAGVIKWGLLTCRSFIGCFGYMSIPLKWWMYITYICEIAICLLAFFIGLKKKKTGSSDTGKHTPFPGYTLFCICSLASCFITLILFIVYNLEGYQPQGRYILPILLPVTFLLSKGMENLQTFFPSISKRLMPLILLLNSLIFLLLPSLVM